MHTLMKKLDIHTHSLFEQSLSSPKDLQSVENLLNFIEKRFQALDALGQKSFSANKHQIKAKSTVLMTNKNDKQECHICKENHPIHYCKNFLSMNTYDRQNQARKLNLCLNCLKKGHISNKCTSRGCTKCSKKHNTLLHYDKTSCNLSEETVKHSENKRVTQEATSLTTQTQEYHESYIFLGTAIADIKDRDGNLVQCRILLDSGSQINLITEKFKQKLKLDNNQTQVNITGLGDSKVKTNGRVNITIHSKTSNYMTNAETYVIKQITQYQPQRYINTDGWNIPDNMVLADPEFNKPEKIDILLGAELYGEIMRNNQLRLGKDLPMMQNTTLGWIVLGKVSNIEYTKQFCGVTNADLDMNLAKFWEIEECPTKPMMSITDKKCEEYFNSTTMRNPDGRFVVNLPMLSDPRLLGDSKHIAYRRLMSIEKKLNADTSLKNQYTEFMQEYIRLGHMTEIKPESVKVPYCFLPHHYVLKPSSSTTKLRVVFDASAKTTNNLSLNDLLLNGPKLQDDLMAIILRFRSKRYVFTADIAKMYRQILVAEEDRNLQLIMWRKDAGHPVKYFQLNTVTYGTKSAPYLAIKCLRVIAEEEAQNYPLGSAAINDFYVDDVMTGSNSLQEAIEIQNQLCSVLKSAKFELRKWCANHPQLIQNIPNENLEIKLDFSKLDSDHVKTLGLVWHPVIDCFAITSTIKNHDIITKRTILAEMSQIFDPLGLVNPVVLMAKMLIQQLWHLNLAWDQELPVELHSAWLKYRNELIKLQEIKIPRYMFSNEQTKIIELHAFSDASEKAYGTALYLRSKDVDGRVTVKLLCAKSRVAPKKTITLPRLELCAAKLCAQLVEYVIKSMNLKLDDLYYWSDSQIVISWIQGDPSMLKTFVANRVAAIQELCQGKKWRYVNTHDNPADLVSRGVYPDQLLKSKLWFEGPDYLKKSRQNWPNPIIEPVSLEEEEKTAKVVLSSTIENSQHPLYRINHKNSFKTLQRVMAYIVRATNNFKGKTVNTNKNLSTRELESALMIIIKEVQRESFKDDIKALKSTGSVNKSSKLATLSPFLDAFAIIRVGGRLEAAEIPYDTKHPYLMPSDHFVTRLLMTHLHNLHLHAGPQALHAITRQKYWVLQGRNIARSITANCVRCCRIRPRLCQQQMGNLPSSRVQQARPFLNTGVDFCGPLYTHFKIRGKKPQKTYIAVFCCFATKAIHLEVVSDLTTEGFLGALKRFVARRERCEKIFCDNATNFVGAKHQLEEVHQILTKNRADIENMCANLNIQFHFNPPRAPHFGGLWEAAVKSTKQLLRNTLISFAPTYEELCTLTAEVEAILNSRPLTPLSNDPNDLFPLTPAHFLIGEPMTATVTTHVQKGEKLSLLSRWALVSAMRELFWKRWSQEYLIELQKRSKWLDEYPNLKPGTLVTIKDDNLPPLKWSMGRVIEPIIGPDKKVRVADVKTSNGILRRAIHQLAPLPVNLDEDKEPTNVADTDAPNSHRTTNDGQPKEIRKRKASVRSMNPLKVLLLTMLAFPLLTHSQPIISEVHNAVQIQRLNQNSGIYFENVGTGLLKSNNWKIMAYYDLTGYHATVTSIEQLLKYLKKLCPFITQNGYYTEITTQYQHQLQEIKNNDILLTTNNTASGRTKRSPLDIVGTITNRLFGILDQEYAEDMKRTIEMMQANEDHIYDLVKNQTSILETTINVIKKTEEQRMQQTKEIKQGLDGVFDKLQNMNAEIKQQKAIQSFNTLSILTSSLISECRFMLDAIVDVVTDTHHGRANQLIISPDQIRSQLAIIKNHLPPGSTILQSNGHFNIALIYKLMSVQCTIMNNYVIFDVKIPLVSTINYQIFNLIPLPNKVNDIYLAVYPDKQYLMTNIYRDQFYLMDRIEFLQCIDLKTNLYLCDQHRPVYSKNTHSESCEIELFLQHKLSPFCLVKANSFKKEWIRLNAANQWLFSFDKAYDITIVCKTDILQKTLSGNGIVKLRKDCTLKDDELILQPVGNINTEISSKSFEPKVNFTFEQFNNTQGEFTPIHSHINVRNHMEQLNSIAEEIQYIKLHQTRLQKLQPHDVHQFSIGYSALALLGIIIIYLVIMRIKNSKVHAVNPTPAPRQHKTTDADFEFKVIDFKKGQDVKV